MASKMGEHRGWTIRVTPHENDKTWTAIVEVWPPKLDHRIYGAIIVPFTRSSGDEAEIIDSGLATARRYIDQVAR